MNLVDSHCHIHFPDYKLDPDEVVKAARLSGVTGMICVGCSLSDSRRGIDFVAGRPGLYASIGLHPHEAEKYVHDQASLDKFAELAGQPKVVAVGECGLDFFYDYSPRRDQIELFQFQLELAKSRDLPLIFHVRDAFADFFKIVDRVGGIKGVVHSFSAGPAELAQILERNFYVGLNGIMTFTKKADQLAAAKAVPLSSMLLETDSPYLTPYPYRGTINQPKHVRDVAIFLSDLRGESLDQLASATTKNATDLFGADFRYEKQSIKQTRT
jgi:TatD DNase family protein